MCIECLIILVLLSKFIGGFKFCYIRFFLVICLSIVEDI